MGAWQVVGLLGAIVWLGGISNSWRWFLEDE